MDDEYVEGPALARSLQQKEDTIEVLNWELIILISPTNSKANNSKTNINKDYYKIKLHSKI